MLKDAQNVLAPNPSFALSRGGAIALTVLGLYLLGNGLTPVGPKGGGTGGVAKSRRVDFCNTLSLPYPLVLTRQCWCFASQTAVLRVTETARDEGLHRVVHAEHG